MQEFIEVIILAIVQGLTEFLPISSSGHLILARELFGWEFEDDLAIDLALHLGTSAALIAYFWREWVHMFRSASTWRPGQLLRRDEEYGARMLLLLALGSVPAGFVGFFFGDYLEEEVRSAALIGVTMIVFALLLLAADRFGTGTKRVSGSTWKDALFVGAAQTLALIPGVSRSGVTITVSLFRQYSRTGAARFSFLLATPITVTAGLYTVGKSLSESPTADDLALMAVGGIVAGFVGWLTIHFLLRLLQTTTYTPFVVYRIVVGVLTIAYFGF